jgi:hypothetical protein
VAAVEKLQEESPEVLDRVEIVCVGRKTAAQQAILDRIGHTRCKLQNLDYCEHKAALRLLSEADALLLLLSDVPAADRVALAVTPEGETAAIVRRFFPDSHFTPSDTAGIASWIATQVSAWQQSGRPTDVIHDSSAISPFTRRHQAGQLAALLERIAEARGRTPEARQRQPN